MPDDGTDGAIPPDRFRGGTVRGGSDHRSGAGQSGHAGVCRADMFVLASAIARHRSTEIVANERCRRIGLIQAADPERTDLTLRVRCRRLRRPRSKSSALRFRFAQSVSVRRMREEQPVGCDFSMPPRWPSLISIDRICYTRLRLLPGAAGIHGEPKCPRLGILGK